MNEIEHPNNGSIKFFVDKETVDCINKDIEKFKKRKEIEEKTNEIVKEFIEKRFYYFSMYERNNYGNFRILSDSSFKEKPFYKDIKVHLKVDELRDVIEEIIKESKYKSYKEKSLSDKRIALKKELKEGKISSKEKEKILIKSKKKIDEEFLGNSFFHGICVQLGIQEILEDKMEPNSNIRCLQKHLELFTLQNARKNSVKDLKGVKFQDDFSSKVIEKFKEFLNENFGIDIAAVNGDTNKEIFNDTIAREDIEKDLFKEDHNLIVLSEEDAFLKNTHVIYFNLKERKISDGADARTISIPKEYDEIEFLKAYLSEEYSKKDITIFSIKKQPNAPADIKFSSLEKIILWILRYWNLTLYAIEKNFYKKSDSEKSEHDCSISIEEDEVSDGKYVIP